MCRSLGAMPLIGDMMPPSTWYTPLYWPVASMLITSRTLSTTHIVLWSRLLSEQMLQRSPSETIMHLLQ